MKKLVIINIDTIRENESFLKKNIFEIFNNLYHNYSLIVYSKFSKDEVNDFLIKYGIDDFVEHITNVKENFDLYLDDTNIEDYALA